MADVRNVHPHFKVSVFEGLDAERVVEILGIFWVDGKGGDLSKVLSPGHFRSG